MPPEQWEISRPNHSVVEDGATASTVRAIDDETVPAVRSPETVVILPIDLEVPRLAVRVLAHRAFDLDRRPVLKPRIVPARPLQ